MRMFVKMRTNVLLILTCIVLHFLIDLSKKGKKTFSFHRKDYERITINHMKNL